MQYTSMVTLRRNSTRTFLLLSSMLAASLSAQTTAETKTEQPLSDDVIELSPFAITTDKDSGYRASNSLAGTRSNTPIKDIALNIQVFTKDLVDDLIVADQTQLERYNAALTNGGADVQSEINIQQAYNNFLFRGFIQNWGLRDGIREYDPVDAQGLARVEIVKGPAAALYGLAYAGGVMNSISKTVDMSRSFGAVRLTGYSEGGYRATVDANYVGKAGDGKFGIRFNAAGSNIEDKRDHSEGNTHFYQTNLEFQPWKGTSIAMLMENSWRQKPIGLGYYTRGAGSNPTKPGEAGIGAVIPLQVDHPEIPWTWNWANVDNNRSLETSLVRGTITQAIGEQLHVTAYLQTNRHQNIDSNGWDDNGNSQNPAGWDVANWSQFGSPDTGWLGAGTSNEKIRKVYHWRDWSNSVHTMGANAVYKFDVSSIKNTLTVGAASWEEQFWTNKWLTADPKAANRDAAGVFQSWKYLPTILPGEFDRANWNATTWDMPVRSGISTNPPPGGAPSDFVHNTGEGGRENNKNSYYYVSWQLSALNNRLKLNAAVNNTTIENIAYGSSSATVANTPIVDVSETSPMFGAMFDITKSISVFGVHSTSLFPTTDKNDFNVQMPPEIGKSNEVGVKIELLNGKISGTVSYYQIEKTGGGVRDPKAINRNKQLWDAGDATMRARFANRDDVTTNGQVGGPLGDLVPAELESKGFEADVVYQPTKSLQLVFSYAHNDEESTKGETKGDTIGGHIDDQFSLLTKYSFVDGAAKGLSLGLGLQYAGEAHQDYQFNTRPDPAAPNTPANDIKTNRVARTNPSTFYVELFAGYKFKAFGFNQFVQLNAKNLTEQDDFIGWKPTGSRHVVATERYAVPTYAKFTLTWGMDF